MKKTLEIVIGIAAVLALLWAFSSVAGFLIKGTVILGAFAVAFFVVRSWWRERQVEAQSKPKLREQKRIEKSAGQTIESLKREVEAARRSKI